MRGSSLYWHYSKLCHTPVWLGRRPLEKQQLGVGWRYSTPMKLQVPRCQRVRLAQHLGMVWPNDIRGSGHLDLQISLRLLYNWRLRTTVLFHFWCLFFWLGSCCFSNFKFVKNFGSIDLLTVSSVDLTKSSKFEFSDAPNWHWLHSSGKTHGNNGNCMTHMMRDMSIFWRQDTEQICQTNW